MAEQTQEQDLQDIANELFVSATAFGIGAVLVDPQAVPMYSFVAGDALWKLAEELQQITDEEEGRHAC